MHHNRVTKEIFLIFFIILDFGDSIIASTEFFKMVIPAKGSVS